MELPKKSKGKKCSKCLDLFKTIIQIDMSKPSKRLRDHLNYKG